MKIPIKTEKEVRIMAEGGEKLARVLKKTLSLAKPGVKLADLDYFAQQLIEKEKGKPSFKMVSGYHWATCLNVNDGVVHGIPNDYRLKAGDLLSVDSGIFYGGFHTDMARTIIVADKQEISSNKKRFLLAGEKALEKAFKVARSNQQVGHISLMIDKELTRRGYFPVQSLTGHGVGKKLHEPPMIPCFFQGKIEETPKLESGMTLAIEVIYLQKKTDLCLDPDGWTVKTSDGSWAGLFEDTILVTPKGARILTK